METARKMRKGDNHYPYYIAKPTAMKAISGTIHEIRCLSASSSERLEYLLSTTCLNKGDRVHLRRQQQLPRIPEAQVFGDSH